jgi:uncharacterized membrane protein YphA (DoxX/SURF4 family)
MPPCTSFGVTPSPKYVTQRSSDQCDQSVDARAPGRPDDPRDRTARTHGIRQTLLPDGSGKSRRLEILFGAVFVIAGLPKFVAFSWELDAFRRFGLPVPQAWVIAVGLIEVIGGLLLVTHRHVREASVLLAITMAIALYVSGILEGDVIPSLTLAPALLAATLFLALRSKPQGAKPRCAESLRYRTAGQATQERPVVSPMDASGG